MWRRAYLIFFTDIKPLDSNAFQYHLIKLSFLQNITSGLTCKPQDITDLR